MGVEEGGWFRWLFALGVGWDGMEWEGMEGSMMDL